MLQLHRLNLDCFIVPQDPTTMEAAELSKGLAEGRLQVFTQQAVARYLSTAEGYEPRNGSADAKELVLRKGIAAYDGLEQIYVDGGPGTELVPCFIRRLGDGEQPQDLEKGVIAEAFQSSGNLRLKKSGKQVKEQAGITLPGATQVLAAAQSRLAVALAACGAAPLEEPRPWRVQMSGEANAPRSFNWRETNWPHQEKDLTPGLTMASPAPEGYFDGLPEDRQPKTAEQAQARRAYNDAVDQVIEASEDVATLKLIIEHVQDAQSFEFDPRQLRLLGF